VLSELEEIKAIDEAKTAAAAKAVAKAGAKAGAKEK
jgi:hypothetical protein